MPTVGLAFSRKGTANGDSGMAFERRNDSSEAFACGLARWVAPRCQVAGPSVFAIPISSRGGHGGEVCAEAGTGQTSDAETTARVRRTRFMMSSPEGRRWAKPAAGYVGRLA